MSDYNQQTPDVGSVDAFGAPSGAKTFFNADTTVGTSIVGTVAKIETAGVRKFKNGEITNELDYWDSGQPKIQLHIVLDTDLPPEDESDEGKRSIWIKGWGKQMAAYREALRLNNGKHPKPGDTFTATYVGLGERGNAPQPPKIYKYEIKPGVSPDVAAFGNEPAQQQAAAPQVTLTPSVTDEQRAKILALRDQGMAPAQVAAQLGLTEQQVYEAGKRTA